MMLIVLWTEAKVYNDLTESKLHSGLRIKEQGGSFLEYKVLQSQIRITQASWRSF